MSSTFFSKDELATTSSITAIPSSTFVSNPGGASGGGGGGGGGGGMQRGASYFFGFLITFIALLLIFIGCGIGTRRRFARRRAQFGAGFEWDGPGSYTIPQERPVLHDPWLAKGGVEWETMLPLSAVGIRPIVPNLKVVGGEVAGTSSSSRNGRPPARSVLERMHHRIFHPRLFGLADTHHDERDTNLEAPPVASESKTKPDSTVSPDLLEVTVMIAMPAASSADLRNWSGVGEKPLDEYVFGVSRIDWNGKDWVP